MQIARLIKQKSQLIMALERVDEATVENHDDESQP